NLNVHTVGFNINNGTGTVPASLDTVLGGAVILPDGTGFTRDGYIFGGWNTNSNGTGINYTAGETFTPTVNIILYAKWDPEN
ncbi:MAG: InlB B-repeat-containing protein, partial [Treponema sp.]|nr:InlB B-repeat-containing protein [Treponema sp.]